MSFPATTGEEGMKVVEGFEGLSVGFLAVAARVVVQQLGSVHASYMGFPATTGEYSKAVGV